MQVVLTQNVPALGKKGEVKSVKDGYFHNYLLPRGLATAATEAKMKEAENFRKRQLVEKEKVTEQAQEIIKKLKGLKITLKGKAKGDKLYGSIGEKEVLDAIQEKLNIRLEKHHLLLSEHIKVVGTYEIPVRITEGAETKFTLEIKGEK